MKRNENDYSTLRKMLDGCGFDWNSGTIIRRVETDFLVSTKRISNNDELLDEEFYCSFGGGGNLPTIVAEDKDKICFPMEYDGAEWLSFVYKDIRKYLNPKKQLPS